MGEELLVGQVLFAAAAGIVEFDSVVVADCREVVGVEEGAGVGELWSLVAVFEASAGVGDGEVQVQLVAGGERGVELVDGVDVAGARRDDVKGAVELNVGDGLLLIGDVDLTDGLRSFVLQDEVAGAGEGTTLGKDVDVGVDRDDLRLGDVFVFFEAAFVVGLMWRRSFAVRYSLRMCAL